MNLCIIGPKNSKSTLKIKLAAEKRGHSCKRVKLIDIYFELKDGTLSAKHRKINLDEFEVFIFRIINKSEREETLALAKSLSERGKVIIDSCISKVSLSDYEILEKLVKSRVPLLNIVRTTGLKSARDILMEISHPVLVKPLDEEDRSRYTASEDWTDSYDIVRTEKSKKFEFQELIETDSFYRSYVIGNEIVGTLKKIPLEKDLRLNFAPKMRSEKAELNERAQEIILTAVQALNYDIASVEIVYKNDEPVLLSVDRAPMFKQFNKIFGVRFEDKVIEYAEKKLSSKMA